MNKTFFPHVNLTLFRFAKPNVTKYLLEKIILYKSSDILYKKTQLFSKNNNVYAYQMLASSELVQCLM